MTTITIKRGSNLKTILKPLGKGESTWKDFAGNWHLSKEQTPMPRGLEAEFVELLNGIMDPEIRTRIMRILQLARLGFLNQNQPSRSDSDTPKVPDNNRVRMPEDVIASPGNSGNGPTLGDQLPRPNGIITHPSANVNSNTERPRFGSGYAGKKSRSYQGSLLLSKGSNFLLKSFNPLFQIQKSERGTFLTGVISSDIIDEQNDSVSLPVLSSWMEKLKSRQINLSYDHNRNISSIIGFFTDGIIQKGADNLNYLIGTAKLNESHKETPHIVETLNSGSKLGLSIEGGRVEYKKTNYGRLITKCDLYKVSVVDAPACQVCHTMGVYQK